MPFDGIRLFSNKETASEPTNLEIIEYVIRLELFFCDHGS